MVRRGVVVALLALLPLATAGPAGGRLANEEDTRDAPPAELDAALSFDNQCEVGDEACTLNALQLRAKQQQEAEVQESGLAVDEAATKKGSAAEGVAQQDNSSFGCAQYGCGGFVSHRPCQCNDRCKQYGNCCPDFYTMCHASAPGQGSVMSGRPSRYSLNWEASGASFFNDFTFMTEDEVHGANTFLNKVEAQSQGVAYVTGSGSAILKVGGASEAHKRKTVNIHTNKAWNPGQSFVALLDYEHLPYGCGVWPGFWAMNSDQLWPDGGEMDILEYANNEGNKVSFHTNKQCYLDSGKIYSLIHGGNAPGPTSCETDYFNANPKLGCRPSQHSRNGAWWSNNPGIVGMEWTPEGVKVFHIPKREIPSDIHEGKPDPDTWNRWIVAYLPFGHGCQNVAQPQELVFNIQLCGDWAGNAWAKSCGGAHSGGCHSDIWDPPADCCTQFVMSPAGEQTIRNAYFEINSIKVYTPPNVYSKLSGTYMRGGVALKA